MIDNAGQFDLTLIAKEIWSLPDEQEKLWEKYDRINQGLLPAIALLRGQADISQIQNCEKLSLLTDLSRFFAEQSLTLRSARQKTIDMVTEIADAFNTRRDGIEITLNDSHCCRIPE